MNQTPVAPDAEKAVLASCIIYNENINVVRDYLSPEDFYSETNRIIYRALLDSEYPDIASITEYLRRHDLLDKVGPTDLFGISDEFAGSSAFIEGYAKDVKEASNKRRAIHGLQKALAAVYSNPSLDTAINIAEAELLALTRAQQSGSWQHMREATELAHQEMMQLRHSDEAEGVLTGLVDLDRMLTSLRPGNLVVLAARPSMGKSAMCFTIAANNLFARSPKSVAMFSLEMSSTEIVSRMLAQIKDARSLTMTQIRDIKRLTDSQMERAVLGFDRLAKLPMWMDDSADMSVSSIRSQARALAARQEIDLIMIDYLQLLALEGNSYNESQGLADATRKLKILARELGCPVLLLSQLNRKVEERPNKRPMLSDLRGSGGIEQDADVVMFLYRDSYYHPDSESGNMTEVIIAKQRNGPIGTVRVTWLPDSARFDNYTDTAAY